MTIFDLKEGMEFKDGATCIKKIKFYVQYNKDNIKGKLFYPDIKEITKELALKINKYNNLNIHELETTEIDINDLKNGYQISYNIYFTSYKNSDAISTCDLVFKFLRDWT
jgi:hypothetical protein